MEVFGLSMLDTVTCGLGGAIVLMLYLASLIPPGAEVQFTNEAAARAADQPPNGDVEAQPTATDDRGRRTAIGMLTVYLKFSGDVPPRSSLPSTCSGTSDANVRVATLRPGGEIFGDEDGDRRSFAHAIWWAADEPPSYAHCIRLNVGPRCEEFRYVAGAHSTPWTACGKVLCFRYAEAEGIYELGSCS